MKARGWLGIPAVSASSLGSGMSSLGRGGPVQVRIELAVVLAGGRGQDSIWGSILKYKLS